jgi:hypothetical protein
LALFLFFLLLFLLFFFYLFLYSFIATKVLDVIQALLDGFFGFTRGFCFLFLF